MPARVSLAAVAGPIQGRQFAFQDHDTFLFDRSPDWHAQLAESDTTTSRHHFLFEVNPPAVRLRDLGSLNGTYVNGTKHGAAARCRWRRRSSSAGRRWTCATGTASARKKLARGQREVHLPLPVEHLQRGRGGRAPRGEPP
jgi:hypothetical protein